MYNSVAFSSTLCLCVGARRCCVFLIHWWKCISDDIIEYARPGWRHPGAWLGRRRRKNRRIGKLFKLKSGICHIGGSSVPIIGAGLLHQENQPLREIPHCRLLQAQRGPSPLVARHALLRSVCARTCSISPHVSGSRHAARTRECQREACRFPRA